MPTLMPPTEGTLEHQVLDAVWDIGIPHHGYHRWPATEYRDEWRAREREALRLEEEDFLSFVHRDGALGYRLTRKGFDRLIEFDGLKPHCFEANAAWRKYLEHEQRMADEAYVFPELAEEPPPRKARSRRAPA